MTDVDKILNELEIEDSVFDMLPDSYKEEFYASGALDFVKQIELARINMQNNDTPAAAEWMKQMNAAKAGLLEIKNKCPQALELMKELANNQAEMVKKNRQLQKE